MALDRRTFLGRLAAGLVTPWVASACSGTGTGASSSSGTPDAGDPDARFFDVVEGRNSADVFPLGMASGDPTTTGVLLWTRIRPEAVVADVKLAFEVATDDAFTTVVARGLVAAADIGAEHDHVVRVDLDGRLEANRRYAYRFIYNGTSSRIGHCRTLPAADAAIESLELVVLTCQDFTNGYYGALEAVAAQDADFVVHLGDFIYESAGDPAFQSLPYADRAVVLPSGGTVAMDLADYRSIYRTYRADERLQRAMEAHTWIMTWDDHETANDCYWDAANDALGAPDHPKANDPAALNTLKRHAQQAWWEYVPARVTYDPAAAHPLDVLKIYRSFRFGTLAHLCMTDERSYRSAPPCGLGQLGGRYVATCESIDDPTQTMLGETQRNWLINEFTTSGALWNVWGNEVLLSPLTVPKIGAGGLERDMDGNFIRVALSLDSWDGFAAERRSVLQALKSGGAQNVLAITGDLHTSILAKAKIDPAGPDNVANVGAMEFMTPAVTSANLKEIVRGQTGVQLNSLLLGVVNQMNPHLHFLDSDRWGFATLTLTRNEATWRVYNVDKDTDAAPDALTTLKAVEVTPGSVTFRDIT